MELFGQYVNFGRFTRGLNRAAPWVNLKEFAETESDRRVGLC